MISLLFQARDDSIQQQKTEEARLDGEISRLCGEAGEMEGSILKEEEVAAGLAAEAQAGGDEASAMAAQIEDLKAGFIFGRLARRDPHFDNVTRRHGYSWRSSGFCEWQRGGVIF